MNKKNILINGLCVRNIFSGAGTYLLNLSNALNKYSENHIIYLFINDNLKIYFDDFKNLKIIYFKFKNIFKRIIFEQFKLPKIAKKLNINFLISSSNILPIFNKKNMNYILVLHDVIFFKYKNRYSLLKNLYYNFFVKKSYSIADKVFCCSKNTINDIETFIFKSDKTKLLNYPPNFYLNNAKNKISNVFFHQLKKIDFFLYVGTLEPGKNYDFILNLAKKVDNKIKIVIVANKGWKYNLKNLSENIILFNNLNYNNLKWLYLNCRIFLYPAIYEGYGYPLLEALNFNKTVISSDFPVSYEFSEKYNFITLPLKINLWLEKIKMILKHNITLNTYKKDLNNFNWKNYINDFLIEL